MKDCVTVHFVSDYHQVYELAFPPVEIEDIILQAKPLQTVSMQIGAS